ncbi:MULTISPECIES: erythromycin esterase family protein [Bacillus]|uniref:erythromycin esterase family protein n=1 Tax=Bacillus TaxID=1386 RepID=UPI0030C9E73F
MLKDKKVILLGENGHGVKEHTKIKIKLIKYLYQELDFRVLAFESNLGDCTFSSMQQMDVNAEQLVKQSLFKVWHTDEMVEFFTWLKDMQSYNSPFIFTGFDIQPSSKESITSEALVSIFSYIGEVYGNQIQELEQDMLYQYAHSRRNTMSKKERKVKYKELQANYKNFLLLLKQNYAHLQGEFDQKTLLLVERVLQNRGQLVDMMTANFMKAIKIRNKMMADNIVWLVQEMFAGEKIIICAHNSHIAKRIKGMLDSNQHFHMYRLN